MKQTLTDLARWVDLVDSIYNSEVDWETKYNLIFSDSIARFIRLDLGIELDYYDPDTTYEEDVRAYVDALKAKFSELIRDPNEPKT